MRYSLFGTGEAKYSSIYTIIHEFKYILNESGMQIMEIHSIFIAI